MTQPLAEKFAAITDKDLIEALARASTLTETWALREELARRYLQRIKAGGE